MKVRNLDTFYWITSLGSFRAASEKLNLTQPAISARIQVLEQDLGTEVFVRDVRNAKLTAEGRKLFAYAERFMHLEQDIVSAFIETTTVEQTIHVGASETIVATWLPEFISTYIQSKKSILSFDLRVDSSNNLKNALVIREIDLAFLMGPVAEANVTNHEICVYEMIFAAHPTLARRHNTWNLDNIAAEAILTFATNTKPGRQLKELFTNSTRQPKITTSSSLGAIIRLTLSEMGICAIPKAVIADELNKGQLVKVNTSVRLAPITFTSSYVSDSPLGGLISDINQKVYQFLTENHQNILFKS